MDSLIEITGEAHDEAHGEAHGEEIEENTSHDYIIIKPSLTYVF